MNHVAHCLLSYPDPDVLLGNFIGDFVKGKSWQQYPEAVQKGILLHRSIDAFTDVHPAVRSSIDRVRPITGRFSPPVVDILLDHLLIRHWEETVALDFELFAEWVYASLDERVPGMPEELQARWPHMHRGRFLHGYGHREGMEWVLDRFNIRINNPFDARRLTGFFFENIEAFSEDFREFFPDLKREVELLF